MERDKVGIAVNVLRSGREIPENYRIEMACIIVAMGKELRDCKNELCLKCGEFKRRHVGACEGCRWLH